jgi:hypothetical protein
MVDNIENFEELEIIKKYFQRLFTILPEDLRRKVEDLNLTNKEKKELIKELGFLENRKQEDYLKELQEILNKY